LSVPNTWYWADSANSIPGEGRLATPDFLPSGAVDRGSAAIDHQGSDAGQPQPADQGQRRHAEGGEPRVCSDLVLALAEVLAAVPEAGVVAHRALPRHVDALLGVETRREGFGVGLLVARAQRGGQRVEHRKYLDGVLRLLPRLGLERHAVMDGVEQADQDEGQQHRGRSHADAVGADPSPGGEQWRIPGDQHAEANAGHDEQPDQDVRPEHDDLEAGHSKRIRGSTTV
jgi:hypothetical protein